MVRVRLRDKDKVRVVGIRARIVRKKLYHDIVGQCIAILRYRRGARQAGDGPAQRRDEDTVIDDSCCQRRPV